MITLEQEKETLLVPLYGKALESQKKRPVLIDKKAQEIVSQIDYDFKSLKIPAKTNTMLCLRAKLIDNFTSNFLNEQPGALILHLGCGLDSRWNRIDTSNADWYDLDFPEVIDIRKQFFPESEHYHLVASTVTEVAWIDTLPTTKSACLVIAEGLFMYLTESEIKQLLKTLQQKIGHFTLIFDAFSIYTAKRVKNHPSLKKTGAQIQWGIDDPLEMSRWDSGIQFVREIYFSSNEELGNLSAGTRFAYRLAHLFAIARKAQRIMVYTVGDRKPSEGY